ncbi:NAD(+)/NADH kinase [Anaerospora sp.]|uniref:NAD(+)/NADH kinase n=1 Tax=Anaerospora sp. TaxID=1960278 RepID=UPI0028997616|nr:NAD(+)/NADH kinase [Anaerospora sp.]MDF2927837.1 ppnK [Anaerospora sp.]
MQIIGIYPNPKKAAVSTVLKMVIEHCAKYAIQVLMPQDEANELQYPEFACNRKLMPEKISLALTLGGDGTLLNVAKEVAPAGIPVCGINLGQLGFLTHIEVSKLQAGLDQLFAGAYRIEERLMLETVIIRNKETIQLPPALNDVVVTKGGFSRLIRLNLYIDNQFTETYPADGLIVATSTGSTGYSLSAGGPIISPNLKVTVITPICPHSLNLRSLIISEEEEVKISFQATTHDDVALTVDGQKVYSLMADDNILVRRSALRAKLVRFLESGFYETLHSKLRRED